MTKEAKLYFYMCIESNPPQKTAETLKGRSYSSEQLKNDLRLRRLVSPEQRRVIAD
jgi:hypothetical protein